MTSGSSGVYLFLYSIFYFFTSSLGMTKAASIVLYFGYMGLISFLFFVVTGTIGFVSTFWFIMKIYAAIKV